MNKSILKIVLAIIVFMFILKVSPVFAISTKTSIVKNAPVATYTDNYIQNLITNTFNKLIGQLMPKDKLTSLLKFSSQLSYDENKGGLQAIYLPTLVSIDDGTSLSIATLSSDDFTSNTATINDALSVSGSAEIQGSTNLGPTRATTLEVGSGDQPLGITIYDRTTKQPVCVFSDNTVLQISAGVCSQ